VSSMDLSLSANSPLAAVTLIATGLGVSGMRSYHDQVAAMTRASERALLGEQMDKLVTAVVMDSRGIYMSTDTSEAEKFAPALIKSLGLLQQRTAEWLALAPRRGARAIRRCSKES
jgi:methyl-accepting chemotaxis protein